MTDDDIRIIEAARDIRGELRDIAGADADELDRALVPLLERADAGENVADAILAVLQRNRATREWLADRLAGSKAEPPPPVAPPSPEPAERPRTRGLDFDRFRRDAEGENERTRGLRPDRKMTALPGQATADPGQWT